MSFEDKNIDEQAEDITTALIFNDETPLFNFDREDYQKGKDFKVKSFAGIIILGGVTLADITVLN